MTCALPGPHDCANVRQANDALRRHLDRACNDRDAALAREQAAVTEGQRLSAEVARLREERDLIAGALRQCVWLAGQTISTSGSPATLSAEAVRRTVEGAVRYVTEPARAALASLGSPQDERNTKKEDAP
jgi:pyruvate-formate lyase